MPVPDTLEVHPEHVFDVITPLSVVPVQYGPVATPAVDNELVRHKPTEQLFTAAFHVAIVVRAPVAPLRVAVAPLNAYSVGKSLNSVAASNDRNGTTLAHVM